MFFDEVQLASGGSGTGINRLVSGISAGFFLILAAVMASHSWTGTAARPPAGALVAEAEPLPLVFEANQGQTAPEVSGLEPLPGVSNYLLGSDPEGWHTDVPQFARVRYEQVYPGIDMVFYGNSGNLEYDFIVSPGVDPASIQIAYSGAKLTTPLEFFITATPEGGRVVSVDQ